MYAFQFMNNHFAKYCFARLWFMSKNIMFPVLYLEPKQEKDLHEHKEINCALLTNLMYYSNMAWDIL